MWCKGSKKNAHQSKWTEQNKADEMRTTAAVAATLYDVKKVEKWDIRQSVERTWVSTVGMLSVKSKLKLPVWVGNGV